MPLLVWLGSLIVSLITYLFSKFIEFSSKRILIIAAVVTGVATFTIAFFAAIIALVNQINAVAPPFFTAAVGLVVPANLPLLISLILTARLLRWVYEWNVKVLQWKLS